MTSHGKLSVAMWLGSEEGKTEKGNVACVRVCVYVWELGRERARLS